MRHRRFVAVPLDHLHPLSQQHRDAGDALWPSVASSSENRTEAVLGTVLQAHGPWAKALGQAPASGRRRPQWRRRVLVVTTYRDWYQITNPTALGADPEAPAQRIDRACATIALQVLVSCWRRERLAGTWTAGGPPS